MKSPIVSTLLAVALVAGLGSLALQLREAPASGSQRKVAAAPLESRTEADLTERLDSLSQENRALRDRLAMLEQRPAAESRTPVDGFVSRTEFDLFRDEVLAALAKQGAQPLKPADELKEQVADVLTAIRKEERIDAVRGYQEKRAARLDQDLTKLEEWLELTPYQVDGMRTALIAQYDREDELRRLWEEGEDEEYLGERKQTDRETFHEEIGLVLDAEQLETFWTRVGEGGKD